MAKSRGRVTSSENEIVYAGMSKAQLIKGGVAVGVILLCAVWLIYTTMSGVMPTETPPATPLQRFTFHSSKIFADEKFTTVSLTPNEEDNSVTVGGTVPTAGEMDQLRAAVEAVVAEAAAGGKPGAAPVTVKWEVRVGR